MNRLQDCTSKNVVSIRSVPAGSRGIGDASSVAWAGADWRGDFTWVGRGGAQHAPATSFALAHDGERLYVAVRCRQGEGAPAEHLAREQVQILLDSQGDGRRAGLFTCSPDCAATASEVLQKSDIECALSSWCGGTDCAASLMRDEWAMVLTVPLGQLRHRDAGLRRVRFNVVRLLRFTDPDAYLSFAPLGPEARFYLPQNVTAEAEFERPEALAAFAVSVEAAGRGSRHEHDGLPVCRQRVRVINRAAESCDLELRAAFHGADSTQGAQVQRRLGVRPDSSQVETVELAAPAKRRFAVVGAALRDPASGRLLSEDCFLYESDPLSWKEHFIRRGDGRGGFTCHAAQSQILPHYQGRKVIPFGLAVMDNGEVICAGTAWPSRAAEPEQTVIAVSADEGATWSEYNALPGLHCRPMMLSYLGNGTVAFDSGEKDERFRLFSHDYGRSWTERVAQQPAPDGQLLGFEGNPLIEYDSAGVARRIAQTGQVLEGNPPHWKVTEYLRWSEDGGRTWSRVSSPEAWKREETFCGKTYRLSGGEGSLVRAGNGWIVAVLRTWVPLEFATHPHVQDSLEGTAVSISRDDGDTWSPLQIVFEGGRHHATLLRMPNDDLVMTVIRRVDFRDGRLAGYRRGCDAVISRDHGATWDVEHLYVLDDFPYCEGERWITAVCGHQYSALLPDGFILTGYGNYLTGGVLIRWRP